MLQRTVQEQYELTDQLQQENEVLKNEVQQNKETIDKQKEEIEELKNALKQHQEEVNKVIEEIKVSKKPEKEEEGQKFYAVVAAFKTLKYAKLYQKVMQRELQMETSVVQSQRISGIDYYFVFTNNYDQFQEAQDEINRLSKLDTKGFIIGSPWIYQLNNK